jgi:hypothetical protein
MAVRQWRLRCSGRSSRSSKSAVQHTGHVQHTSQATHFKRVTPTADALEAKEEQLLEDHRVLPRHTALYSNGGCNRNNREAERDRVITPAASAAAGVCACACSVIRLDRPYQLAKLRPKERGDLLNLARSIMHVRTNIVHAVYIGPEVAEKETPIRVAKSLSVTWLPKVAPKKSLHLKDGGPPHAECAQGIFPQNADFLQEYGSKSSALHHIAWNTSDLEVQRVTQCPRR